MRFLAYEASTPACHLDRLGRKCVFADSTDLHHLSSRCRGTYVRPPTFHIWSLLREILGVPPTAVVAMLYARHYVITEPSTFVKVTRSGFAFQARFSHQCDLPWYYWIIIVTKVVLEVETGILLVLDRTHFTIARVLYSLSPLRHICGRLQHQQQNQHQEHGHRIECV
jgi:hypothetical protein